MKRVLCFGLCSFIISSTTGMAAQKDQLVAYRKIVVEQVKKKIPKMRACYQNQLDKSGHIKGRTVTFVFSIAKEGYLEQIHVREDFNMEVLRCVNVNLAGMQFPKTPNGKTFILNLPLNFKINYH